MYENAAADNELPPNKAHLGVGPTFPRFSGLDIADACLRRLFQAASLVPSDWNSQTWRWIVVRRDGGKKYLEGATYLKIPLSSAPVVLICIADTLAWKSAPQYLDALIASRKITEEEGRETLRRVWEYYSSSPEVAKRTALANAFAAVHQVLLGAEECNLSAHWVTEFDESKLKTQFHIPDHFLVAALVAIGYREETQVQPVSSSSACTFVYKEKFGEALAPTP